jgi:hypothetical protein
MMMRTPQAGEASLFGQQLAKQTYVPDLQERISEGACREVDSGLT